MLFYNMPLEKRSLLKNSTCFTALLIIGIEQAFKYDLDATMDTKKQAEEAMRENEQFLKKIFDSIQDGISVIDINFKVIKTNRWMEEIYGHQMPLVGKKCYQVYQGKNSPCQRCPSLKSIKTGDVHTEVVPYPSETNPEGWIELFSFPVKDEKGRVTHVIEYVKDITARKKAEEALRESEDKFRSLVEITSDWIWEVDRNGIYSYVSPKIKTLLGYEPQELIGKATPFDFMPEGEADKTRKLFKSIVSSRKSLDGLENTNIHKDGHLVVLETSGVPVFDKVGNFTGYRGVDRDITDRKRTEDELLQEKKKLENALNEIRKLSGLLPICSSCKKIRDDKGYWNDLEAYIEKHSDALFTHGMCPECSEKLYGKEKWYVKMKKRKGIK